MSETVRIDSMAFQGAGVSRAGKVTFVHGAFEGDLVTIDVTKETSKYREGRVREILERSTHRTKGPCFHDLCGGCGWKGLSIDRQRHWKMDWIQFQLTRRPEIEVQPILLSHEPWGYRSRVQLRGLAKQHMEIGYFESQTHHRIAVSDCPVVDEPLQHLIREVSQWQGSMAETLFRAQCMSLADGSVCTELHVVHGDEGRLKEIFAPFGWVGNAQDSFRAQPMCYDQDGVSYLTLPGQFQQAHRALNRQVRQLIEATVDQVRPRQIWDLYGGSGNLSFRLGQRYPVTIVESCPRAEISLRAMLAPEDKTVRYERGDVPKVLGRLSPADFVILDPPRDGAPGVLPRLTAAEHVIYVSCNPSTLFRDLDEAKAEFRVKSWYVMDFFPQTYHVENLVILERKDRG